MIPLILCQINWWQFQRKIHLLSSSTASFYSASYTKIVASSFYCVTTESLLPKVSDGQKVYYFATGSFISVERNPTLKVVQSLLKFEIIVNI